MPKNIVSILFGFAKVYANLPKFKGIPVLFRKNKKGQKNPNFLAFFSYINKNLLLGTGREATRPTRKKKWPRPWPAVQAAKKRPVHLTANDRAWPAKSRPTDGPTVKWPAKF
ncbi:hypothetical protein BpHYR1_031436 [Brachionus plicatilis]|uniref:Uncharacterized protein n=1 Tax=Brachionus plicatilis TaxID=10195 RepID=A0A3M7PWP5_BRAPC|nr:hypothetical protein BpHYR1_031436 [Brachionus plicatilis]